MQGIICFTSDFGMGDTWVGICHAVMYKACPQARVVDLAHDVAPYDIRKAAAVAAAGVWQLPDAIHLVVVDPGVGPSRKDVCLVTGNGTILVGPDNGVLVPSTWRSGGINEAYELLPDSLSFRSSLATFHARDVLAPAAAALACGVDPSAIGMPIDAEALAAAPFQRCHQERDALVAEVVDVDRFGSVRIAVSPDVAESQGFDHGTLEISFGHLRIEAPFAATFSDVPEGEPVLLIDSSGWLTLAIRLGSAAERYGIEPGATARIRRAG